MKKRALDTRLLHAGEKQIDGSVSVPIFQSSTYLLEGDAPYEDIRYGRMSNTPTHEAVQQKIAAAESGEAALVTSSGMGAIANTMLTFLEPGDHLVVQDTLYGGTWSLVHEDLPRYGIEFSTFPSDDPRAIVDLIRDETKLIYAETITNPLIRVTDHAAVVEAARARGIPSAIDNTFATPVNFRPLELGYDIVLHSATKYLNGHTDLIAGVVVGTRQTVESVRQRMVHFGGNLNAISSYLLYRGLKTLALRVRRHNENAMALARALEDHPAVARVHYPGLASSPSHETASRLLEGFGGMLAIDLEGGESAALALMDNLELAVSAPSLGGVETLISRPATSSHAGMSPRARHEAGISDGLVRISTGVEDPGDLVDDFVSALGRV